MDKYSLKKKNVKTNTHTNTQTALDIHLVCYETLKLK